MATLVTLMSTLIVGILLISPSICALHTEQGKEDLQALQRAPRKLKVGEGKYNEEEEKSMSEFMNMDYYQPKKRRSAHNDYPRPNAP